MSDERPPQSERKPYNKHAPRTPRPEEKKINVDQVVTYLSHAFSRAQQKAIQAIGNRNFKGSKLYEFQVEFCYMIDEIQRGPVYILPKVIQDANQLIVALERSSVPSSTEEVTEVAKA